MVELEAKGWLSVKDISMADTDTLMLVDNATVLMEEHLCSCSEKSACGKVCL